VAYHRIARPSDAHIARSGRAAEEMMPACAAEQAEDEFSSTLITCVL